jgi:hypothetical protein
VREALALEQKDTVVFFSEACFEIRDINAKLRQECLIGIRFGDLVSNLLSETIDKTFEFDDATVHESGSRSG